MSLLFWSALINFWSTWLKRNLKILKSKRLSWLTHFWANSCRRFVIGERNFDRNVITCIQSLILYEQGLCFLFFIFRKIECNRITGDRYLPKVRGGDRTFCWFKEFTSRFRLGKIVTKLREIKQTSRELSRQIIIRVNSVPVRIKFYCNRMYSCRDSKI